MMILAAIALALQAAPTAPAPAPPPPAPAHPEVTAAGEAWSDCARRVIDATIGSGGTDEALVTGAFAGCTAQEAAVRAAVARHIGADAADGFIARVTEDARITILHYLRRMRQN